DGRAGGTRTHVDARDQLARPATLAAQRQHPEAGDAVQVRQRDVVDDRAEHEQTLALAVLREHDDAVVDRLARRAQANAPALHLDLALLGPVGAEDRARDLGAPAADQPG